MSFLRLSRLFETCETSWLFKTSWGQIETFGVWRGFSRLFETFRDFSRLFETFRDLMILPRIFSSLFESFRVFSSLFESFRDLANLWDFSTSSNFMSLFETFRDFSRLSNFSSQQKKKLGFLFLLRSGGEPFFQKCDLATAAGIGFSLLRFRPQAFSQVLYSPWPPSLRPASNGDPTA